jgi:hypothetical protein
MRVTMHGRTILGALTCLAIASGSVSGPAWASGRTLLRSIAPARVPHGPGSPFKLSRSAAHGVIVRRGDAMHAAAAFSPLSSQLCAASCAPPLLYHNGAVMRKVKVYIVQWEPPNPGSNGQAGTSFTALEPAYRAEVGEYVQKVAAASGTLGNVYSVDSLYGEYEAGGGGAYSTEFGEVLRDEEPYPERKTSTCPLPTGAEPLYPPSNQPCISDGESGSEENFQLADGLFKFLQKHPSLPIGLGAMYFILTPHGVNSCAGFEGGVAACNTNYYCAYHSGFDVENAKHERTPVIYANMPYDDVPGCETPDQPHKSPADDEIDTLSHEDNEAITDPLGEGWYDNQGQEVADKCTYPFFDPAEDNSPLTDAYGTLLGGTPKGNSSSPGTAYNQEISGGQYLLQREWSNVANGCVAHAPNVSASFVVSQQSETKLTFNGESSTTEAGQIVEYAWTFSGGTGGSTGSAVEHTFPVPGEYTVSLTARNDSGAVGVDERKIRLEPGEKGILTSTTTTTTTRPAVTTTQTSSITTSVTLTAAPFTTTTTSTTTATAPATASLRYKASEIAKLLGLPANGKRLASLGSIFFGHAECPPACEVTLKLTAKVTRRVHGHRVTRWTPIGTAQIQGTPKGAVYVKAPGPGMRELLISLSSAGRALLRKHHRLPVRLFVRVEESSGASWTIERHLTLTSGAKSARHRSHAARRR